MNTINKLFWFVSDFLVEARKAKAEAVSRRIGR